jgi:hypothetical protein
VLGNGRISNFARMPNIEKNPILEFFRCPDWFADTVLNVRLGDDLVAALSLAYFEDPVWRDLTQDSLSSDRMEKIIGSLRKEHYEQAASEMTLAAIVAREAYYLIRPLLGVTVRRLLQRLALAGWKKRAFPRWPVDRTVDQIHEALLTAAMTQKCVQQVPFIWFWPDGHSACAMVTHDVETRTGLEFCSTLMDIDDSAGIKSSFQLVPEQRYTVSEEDLHRIRSRGFEVNVHDLNHDGHLFRDHATFCRRAGLINEYGKRFGANGFRSGALYRNQDWFDALEFAYEMSVPNVAHLDPQHGGCCTIFPYFVGHILEMPVTATQDYSLFHVLRTYSTDLWRRQIEEIVAHHGMFHVIAHPDYLLEQRARDTYKELLHHLAGLREKHAVWLAQPHEVNAWWRQRADMRLVWVRDHWSIVGDGSQRAIVAYFELNESRPSYHMQQSLLGTRAYFINSVSG